MGEEGEGEGEGNVEGMKGRGRWLGKWVKKSWDYIFLASLFLFSCACVRRGEGWV